LKFQITGKEQNGFHKTKLLLASFYFGVIMIDISSETHKNIAALHSVSPAAKRLYEFMPKNCWMTAENLAKAIHVRKETIGQLKNELEAARLIDVYFYINGKRANPKHEIVKRTGVGGNSICKHISRAYCIDEWSWLDRNSLIECYLKSGWNIIPFTPREKRPIDNFFAGEWNRKSADEKMDFFFNNPTLNVGLAVCHFTIVDVDSKTNSWLQHQNFGNTLTVSTARGFQSYFRNDSVITTSAKVMPDIDTRCKGSFVVLPPSIHPTGTPYEWAMICKPELLPIEFRREWRQRYFDACDKSSGFLLPSTIPEGMRNDTIWRYGRGLKCSGKTFFEVENELRRINFTICEPPLSAMEMERLINHVWNHRNRSSFQSGRKR